MIITTDNLEETEDFIKDILKKANDKYSFAAPYQTLFEHSTNMLETYESNKAALRPHSEIIDAKLWDQLVKIAIIFHDLGKLNVFFQFHMISKRDDRRQFYANLPHEKHQEIVISLSTNDFPKAYTYHVVESSILAFYFLTDVCNSITNDLCKKEMVIKIVVNSILAHHLGHYKLTDRIDFLREYRMSLKRDNQFQLWTLFLAYLRNTNYLAKIIDKLDDEVLQRLLTDFLKFIGNNIFSRTQLSKLLGKMYFNFEKYCFNSINRLLETGP
jgi:CRISPR-associated endonuclease Cas3-HD